MTKIWIMIVVLFLSGCVEQLEPIEIDDSVISSEHSDKSDPIVSLSLSNIKPATIKENEVVINWQSNLSTEGQIEYGLTTAYGFYSKKNSNLLKSHSHIIENLKDGTLYHYRIRAKDENGKEVISSNYTITTLKKAVVLLDPKIVSQKVLETGESSAKINIKTDQDVSVILDYGVTSNLGKIQNSSSFKKEHNLTISNLNADTTYYYKLKIKSSNRRTAQSSQLSFKTKAKVVVVPNLILSDLIHQDLGETTVAISWKLNHPATGQVEYGKSSSLGLLSLKENSFIYSSHKQTLKGLDEGTTYYYRVRSKDQNGKEALSEIKSFKTLEKKVDLILEAKAPVILSAIYDNGGYVISFKKADGSRDADGGYDTWIDGVDLNDNQKYSGFTRKITGLDTTQRHCFQIQSRFLVPTYIYFESKEECVEAVDTPSQPKLNADVKYWKDRFDSFMNTKSGFSTYADKSKPYNGNFTNKTAIDYMVNQKNANQEYYFLAYYIDAYLSIWQATGEDKYLNRLLEIVEKTMDLAVPMKGRATGYLGWPMSPNYFQADQVGSTVGNEGVGLWDSYYWRFVASLVRIMHKSPKLRARNNYQARYKRLLDFSEKHIWERYEKIGVGNFYRINTHMSSHWARIGMELYIVTGKSKYKTVFDNISFGKMVGWPSNMRNQITKTSNGAYTWSANWTSRTATQDTSHGGAVVSYMTTAYDNKMYWNKSDIDALLTTSLKVIWPDKNGSVRKYVNGSGGNDYNGRFHEWLHLGKYSQTMQNKIKDYYQTTGNLNYYGLEPLGIAALNAKILSDGKPAYPEN